MRRARRAGAAAALLALAAAAGAAPRSARADSAALRVDPWRVEVRASASPAVARLGERITLRWTVRPRTPVRARIGAPASGGAFHWSGFEARPAGVRDGRWPRGEEGVVGGAVPGLEARADLQVFALGDIAVPGPALEIDDGRGRRVHRLPMVRVTIVPVVAANDSAADLRPARGPLAAPWWERVPWRLVAAVALLGALAVALVVGWRRRRRRAAAAAAPAAPRARRDPFAEALAELAALRRLDLPGQGRFDEHALRLTRIARRVLETVAAAARPGDSTPEIVEHLVGTAFDGGEIERVEGLLRFWDRVKFARAPITVAEARAAEDAVEDLIRRHAPAPAAPTAPGRAA
uniref:Protein BatD n=1 Tax=Eiseniibacteriota bacterium TaxID=2212470 RepID=A0A832MMH7_UNCEI